MILSLLHRRAVELARQEQRHRAKTRDTRSDLAGGAPDEKIALTDQRRLVEAALHQLPPEHREVLELAYFGGLNPQHRPARST